MCLLGDSPACAHARHTMQHHQPCCHPPRTGRAPASPQRHPGAAGASPATVPGLTAGGGGVESCFTGAAHARPHLLASGCYHLPAWLQRQRGSTGGVIRRARCCGVRGPACQLTGKRTSRRSTSEGMVFKNASIGSSRACTPRANLRARFGCKAPVACLYCQHAHWLCSRGSCSAPTLPGPNPHPHAQCNVGPVSPHWRPLNTAISASHLYIQCLRVPSLACCSSAHCLLTVLLNCDGVDRAETPAALAVALEHCCWYVGMHAGMLEGTAELDG